MTQEFRDFRLQPAARVLWRRAADELLIDAIFGPLPHPEGTAVTMPPPMTERPLSLDWRRATPSSPTLEP